MEYNGEIINHKRQKPNNLTVIQIQTNQSKAKNITEFWYLDTGYLILSVHLDKLLCCNPNFSIVILFIL